jgi:hypothetical protein
MSVYIEHVRPLNPSSVRRYEDIHEAALGISRDSHVAWEAIESDLGTELGFQMSGHSWRAVTAEEMFERSTWALMLGNRIRLDMDVSDLD